MYKLAHLSLGNRALIALVTIFVLVFGVVTTMQLKQELIPSLSLPTAVVYTTYPGASPQVVEESVTSPVEQAVLGLSNLDSTTSTSSTGVSQVQVNFVYGTNMSTAQQDLQAAMSRIQNGLPDGADYQVVTGSLADFPVIVMSVDDNTNNPAALADRVDELVTPELKKLEGVRSVDVSGAPVKQVSIQLDENKLTDNELTANYVNQLLQSSGALINGGSVTSGDKTLSVTIGKKLTSAADVGKLRLVVRTSTTGQTPNGPVTTPGKAKTIPLTDVATVVPVNAPKTSISRTNGKSSLTIAVTKTPEGNTVDVSKEVNAELADLQDKLGNDASFTTVFDQAPFISNSITALLQEGGLGLAMAIVVILIFLLSVRSTIVTAVSIPVSVLITLIGLRASDYTLNIITLGALTISVGRVVDDSIVVIENIKRHLSYGEDKITAIKTAVREVARAITSATVTTVAVFLPLALVGGQVGELFRPFAVTVSLALLASLFVALTIVPVLAYWFLATPTTSRDPSEVAAEAYAKERKSALQRGYVPILSWWIRHPVAAILIAVLLLVGTGAGAASGRLKTDFLGQTGQNTLSVTEKFAPGLSLGTKAAQSVIVEQVIRGIAGVDTVQTTVGRSGGASGAAFGYGGGNDSASFNVTTASGGDQGMIERDLRDAIDKLTGVGDITVRAGQGYGSSAVDVIITAPDTGRLATANNTVLAALKGVGNVTDVSSSLSADQPLVQVTLDENAAGRAGLTDASIAQALKGILAPQKVGEIETGGTTQDIVVDLGSAPAGLAELRAYKITTPTGDQVKLDDVADVAQTNVAASIGHNNTQRSITVSLTPAVDNLQVVNTDVTNALAGVDLPAGVSTRLGGVSSDQSDAFSQLGLALLVAIAIVYIVMVATFKSLVQPLILLVSVPFAATGALAALLLTGTPLGVPSLIGLLMLIGIVVTNAIVLIDLVNHYRADGDTVDQALVDGARQRLRPILMTALATIFALVPMSLGLTGGGLFISKPLAIVVIGGLFSSTVLTLLVVPVLYHLVESRREKSRAGKQETVGDAADAKTGGTATDEPPAAPEQSQPADAAAGAGLAVDSADRGTDNGRYVVLPQHAVNGWSATPAADGMVNLPAAAVDGLATAAEGLARAFRGMTGSSGQVHHQDVMDVQTEVSELEGRTNGTATAAGPRRPASPEPEPADDYDADLGQRGPRHAR